MTSDEEKQKELEAEKESEEIKKLVADTIAAKCMEEDAQQFEELKVFKDALKAGDSLSLQILSGGETNYAYKATLSTDPSKALFAKISFNFARWNPDKTVIYDVKRAENEFAIMNSFAEQMGGHGVAPVAKPFYCLDVPGDAKLLIAQWSPTDVQFSNQFMDGQVDMRVIDKLAETLAILNLTPVEAEWNENCRSCMQSLHPLFKQIFGQFVSLPDDQADAAAMYCKELGLEALELIVDNLDQEYAETRQLLCHNDTKQFNILVEEKPSPTEFGEKGTFAICDWEMTIKGRSGKDIGIFQAWAIACALCHAVQGHKQEAYHILDVMTRFWEKYETALREKGDKGDEYLLDAYKGCLGSCFLYLHVAYYMLVINAEDLPLEGVAENVAGQAKGAMGATGLKMGEVAYLDKHSDFDLTQIKAFFEDTVRNEIDSLLARRPSHQREAGRRPSDALLMEQAARRVSLSSEGRASVYSISIPDEVLDLDDDEED